MKHYSEAIEDYNKAIKLRPKYATAYNNRGWARLNLENYNDAIDDFQMAIILNPNKLIYKNNLKWAQEKLLKK